ncbi:MAG: haloacid dehalogenase [Candidatus Hinthialibacteria bacterium]
MQKVCFTYNFPLVTNIKLVAFDLDGTLLDSHKRIRKDAAIAIEDIQASGVYVTLVTGRSYAATVGYARQLNLSVPFGLFHGALVKDLNGLEIAKRAIPSGGVREAIRQAGEFECIPMILGIQPEGGVTFSEEDRHHPAVQFVIKLEQQENPESILHFHPRTEIRLDAYTVYIMGHKARLIEMLEAIHRQPIQIFNAERFPVYTGGQQETGLEEYEVAMLSPIGADKKFALETIADSLGVAMKDVLAFGDWHNDIPMLQAAGSAVLMGNAPAGIVEKIQHPNLYRTGPNDGSGIVDALRRFGLG